MSARIVLRGTRPSLCFFLTGHIGTRQTATDLDSNSFGSGRIVCMMALLTARPCDIRRCSCPAIFSASSLASRSGCAISAISTFTDLPVKLRRLARSFLTVSPFRPIWLPAFCRMNHDLHLIWKRSISISEMLACPQILCDVFTYLPILIGEDAITIAFSIPTCIPVSNRLQAKAWDVLFVPTSYLASSKSTDHVPPTQR